RKVARRGIQKVNPELFHKKTESSKPSTEKISLEIDETITDKTIQKLLGPRKYRVGTQNKHDEIGICTGLAWTEAGGDLLAAEVNILPGRGKLTITGKLGDVMKESAQAAISYVRSRATFLG